jgi:glucose/arabinose dehydrogenase
MHSAPARVFAALLLASAVANASVADLEAIQRAHAALRFQYGFEGSDDATRLADGSGNGHTLQRVAGQSAGSVDGIAFVAGYEGASQAYRPAFSTSGHMIGAGLATVAANVPLGPAVTVETVIKFDPYSPAAGGAGSYLLCARPAGKQRAYFLRQLDTPVDRISSTFGDNLADTPAVLSYTPDRWYYLALTASYSAATNLTTVNWYGANLNEGLAPLIHLGSDNSSFTGDWTGNSQVGVGCFLNGRQEYLQGAIDSIALTNATLTPGELQTRLDSLLWGGSEPVAADDMVEVGVSGAVAIQPLSNDSGPLNPASLEIIVAPTHGSVTPGAAPGTLVYRHGGGTPGGDHFRYRIAHGGLTAEADVHLSVVGALRLAAPSLAVPLEPPAAPAGGLVAVDALPGLTFPHAVAMRSVPGDPKALLVATIKSQVWLIPDTTAATPVKHLVLDLSSLTNLTNGRSIYSIECFPDFATTGHMIVNYQGDRSRLPLPNNSIPNLDRNGAPFSTITCDLRVSRFTLSSAHLSAAADGLSAEENAAALATEWPYLNLAEQGSVHTIGDAKFGPDGYLYVSFGDEGEQESSFRNTQTITKDQFSAILRLDVNPASNHPKPNPHYAIAAGPLNGSHSPNTPFTNAATQEPNFRIPADNPYVVPAKGGNWDGSYNGIDHAGTPGTVRDEIWATGFRNPFKFHVDSDQDGVFVFVGDNGRYDWEEFNVIRNGDNAGWAYYEGSSFTPPIGYSPAIPSPHRPAIHSYPHANGNGSATGGVFYRGTALPELTGRFIGGDFNSGRVWSIGTDGGTVVELHTLRQASERIVDFEVDPETGDIFVLENNTWSGGAAPRVLRITRQQAQAEDYPQKLSELGVFADLSDLAPNPGVVAYQPNLGFWSDGALKRRWFAIANLTDSIGWSAEDNWTFPEGMVWVKHFDFDLDRSQAGTQVKRLETRVLVRNASGSYGVSYRWNEAGTEATLVANEGDDFAIAYTDAAGSPATLDWRIPARSECASCHTATGGHALSMNTRQFNLTQTIAGQSGNLLELLSAAGYLAGFPGNASSMPRHHRPDESTADLEARVRSYLAVNCSYCHQAGGNAPPSWDGRAHLAMADTGILYGATIGEGAPDPTDHLVRPGDRDHSAIWNRINAREAINGSHNGYTQMPPLATNAFDPDGIALLGAWIDHHANVPPAAADGSLATTAVSENAGVGHGLGTVAAVDPDVRSGIADQAMLTHTILSGNNGGLFSLDPASGALRVNGWIDHERQAQHVLTIETSDHFAPNPGILQRTVIVDLVDETSPDHSEDLDGDGLFDHWESIHHLADPAGDEDRDGLPNVLEFLSGTNPNLNESPALAGPSLVGADGLAWNVRNGFMRGSDYRIEQSGDLTGWTSLSEGSGYQVISVTPVSPGISRVVIRVPSAEGRSFLRLAKP